MGTHRLVDVLDTRESAALANRVRAHPGVEVICWDRATAYAEGAMQGAPGAIQASTPLSCRRPVRATVPTPRSFGRQALGAGR
jgi:hypothetical protein